MSFRHVFDKAKLSFRRLRRHKMNNHVFFPKLRLSPFILVFHPCTKFENIKDNTSLETKCRQSFINRLAESYGDYSGSYGFLRLEEEYWFRMVFFCCCYPISLYIAQGVFIGGALLEGSILFLWYFALLCLRSTLSWKQLGSGKQLKKRKEIVLNRAIKWIRYKWTIINMYK